MTTISPSIEEPRAMDIDEQILREFPSFDYKLSSLLKCLPRDWTINAWHNDTCPYFAHMGDNLDRFRIWCEWADPKQREVETDKQFIISETEYDDSGNLTNYLTHLETDNFCEVVQWCYENNKLVTGMEYVPLENSVGEPVYPEDK